MDYYSATWDRVLSIAKVPTDSIWRQPGSIYYHPNIREVTGVISSPPAPVLEASEQPLTIQANLPLPEASKGSN